jgi:hypothetical protein
MILLHGRGGKQLSSDMFGEENNDLTTCLGRETMISICFVSCIKKRNQTYDCSKSYNGNM